MHLKVCSLPRVQGVNRLRANRSLLYAWKYICTTLLLTVNTLRRNQADVKREPGRMQEKGRRRR